MRLGSRADVAGCRVANSMVFVGTRLRRFPRKFSSAMCVSNFCPLKLNTRVGASTKEVEIERIASAPTVEPDRQRVAPGSKALLGWEKPSRTGTPVDPDMW